MEQHYAQALWKMIQNGKKPKEAVHALHEMLMRLGRASLLPKIARAFGRIAERAQSQGGVALSIAREKDERSAHKAVKQLLSEMGIDAKDVTTHVDGTLIGGWRLEGRENLVDASFKKYLLGMYNRATSA